MKNETKESSTQQGKLPYSFFPDLVVVGKTYKFDAAHFLPGHLKCGTMHGHTWTVTVEITGQVGDMGMVLDFEYFDRTVKSVLFSLDHRALNEVIDGPPTCENLAVWIVERLDKELKHTSACLYSVTVQEGAGGYARVEL